MGKLFIENSAIGAQGSKIVTGTEVVSVSAGTYYAVQFVTECTPTTFTFDKGEGTYSGVTYPAGLVVYGDITAITAGASESYILYKK